MSALASDKGLILVLYMHSVLRMRKNLTRASSYGFPCLDMEGAPPYLCTDSLLGEGFYDCDEIPSVSVGTP